jgi:hypothetical protein
MVNMHVYMGNNQDNGRKQKQEGGGEKSKENKELIMEN